MVSAVAGEVDTLRVDAPQIEPVQDGSRDVADRFVVGEGASEGGQAGTVPVDNRDCSASGQIPRVENGVLVRISCKK